MSLTTDAPTRAAWSASLSDGARAALVVLVIGAICRLLGSYVPWLVTWPEFLVLPVTQWVGDSVGWLLGLLKPLARMISTLLGYPMTWVGAVLGGAPWPLIIGGTTALGWYLGGLRLALLGAIGLGLVLLSGYWVEGMNTLALVAVSVPLALLSGLAIGILAYEVPRIKGAVNATLDVMQTVPTFAYLTPLLLLFGFGPVVGLIASAIYAAPQHPYTKALLASVPTLGTGRADFQPIKGEIPSPLSPPPGCAFHPRCPFAGPRCKAEVPRLGKTPTGQVACHLNDGGTGQEAAA